MHGPIFFFDYVNNDGSIYYYDSLFTINMGENKTLPIHASFDNSRSETSPYLGYKWRLNLFESIVYQESENLVRVRMPDGYLLKFNKISNDIYRSETGFLGKQEGETFSISATCGGEQLVFKKGLLENISLGSRKLKMHRNEQGLINEISDSKTKEVLASAEYNTGVGLKSLKLNSGEIITIEQILANNKDGIRVPFLSRVGYGNSRDWRSYNLDIDQNSLHIANQWGDIKKFEWDDLYGIKSDGQYRFEVNRSGSYPIITKRTKNGEYISYFKDSKLGVEEVDLNGSKERTYRYKNRPIFNLIRKVEKWDGSKWITNLQRYYDSEGRLFKEVNNGEGYISQTTFQGDKKVTSFVNSMDGQVMKKITQDEKGRILQIDLVRENKKIKYNYDNNGSVLSKDIQNLN